jgi:hypothetical protein
MRNGGIASPYVTSAFGWRGMDNLTPRPHYPPPPEKEHPAPILYEVGWAPE